jgi:hypothetical protein
MRIVLASNVCEFANLRNAVPDLIVLPECVPQAELPTASQRFPSAIVVGAFKAAGHIHGEIWRHGQRVLGYAKVGNDRYDSEVSGASQPETLPVHDFGPIVIAVLVCMDIDDPTLWPRVAAALHASPAPHKMVCVPAAMTGGMWFLSEPLGDPSWAGLRVVVSNANRYPGNRMQSFVSTLERGRLEAQVGLQPLSVDLD